MDLRRADEVINFGGWSFGKEVEEAREVERRKKGEVSLKAKERKG